LGWHIIEFLSDIYTLLFTALARCRKEQEAERLAKQYSSKCLTLTQLACVAKSGLVGALSLKREKMAEAELLAEDVLRLVSELDADDFRRDMLKSNAAFLYLEMGKSQEAANFFLRLVSGFTRSRTQLRQLGTTSVRKRGALKKERPYTERAMRLTRSTYDRIA